MFEVLRDHLPTKVFEEISLLIDTFQVNTELRIAHFLAQCSHESEGFRALTENLNYSAEALRRVFGKYFPGDLADVYAKQGERIGNRVYANRMGNGDEASGDGFRYRGRGYLQITGKINYRAFDAYVVESVINFPELLATKYPLLSAGWYWNSRALNKVADRGATDDVVLAITKVVNGGTNGLSDRLIEFKKFSSLLLPYHDQHCAVP